MQTYLPVSAIFWSQLIIGAVVQALHFVFVPETRSSCLVTAEAKRRRSLGEINLKSEAEIAPRKVGMAHAVEIWLRPFKMFLVEPIVLALSLISGFADALIFTFLDSMGLVYAQWNFNAWQTGFVFIPIALGYLIAYGIWASLVQRGRKTDPNNLLPIEHKLKWLLWTAPFLVLGIFGFGGTTTGPPIPWIVPTLFLIPIGVANMAIYGSTIDYMIATYGEKYSASACGGNGFARDVLAGIAAMYAHPMYTQIGNTGPDRLRNASFILGGIGTLLIIPIYIVYLNGEWIRSHCLFAKEVEMDRRRRDTALPQTEK